MTDRLKIEEIQYGGRMRTVKVTGFRTGELSELKSMEHRESEEKLMDMLDVRNDGIGTRWACGYGVYGIWYDNEAAYINIGNSSD